MKKIVLTFLCLIILNCIIVTNVNFAVTEKDNQILKIYNAESERYGLAFDIEGYNNGQLVQTTWGNNSKESGMSGYMTYLKVDNNEAQKYVNYTGDMTQNINGIDLKIDSEFVNDGKYIKVIYTVKNNNSQDSSFSLGTCADVQIGDNDKATVERINDSKGVKLYSKDENLQFSFYGKAVEGVTDIDNLWIKKWEEDWYKVDKYIENNVVFANNDTTKIENLDSSFAYSWVNRTIKAGETKQYSVLIGVGAISNAPEIKLTTKDKQEIAKDSVKLKGTIEDADLTDTETLYYSIDSKEEKKYSKVYTVKDGKTDFELDLTDEKLELGNHTIKLWAIDSQGNPSNIVTITISVVNKIETDTSSGTTTGTEPKGETKKTDATTIQKTLPKTGLIDIIVYILPFIMILGIISAIKYFKNRDIK